MLSARCRYTFHQTSDLAGCEEPYVSALRTYLYDELRPWMQHVLGVALSDRPNLFCAKYGQGDTLLCHDDELEGRCVAFILYLVPADWTAADGGSLQLYNMDGDQPSDCAVSLVPGRGSLAFFEVTPQSYHRVSEVLAKGRCRLSVSGWYYGATTDRLPVAPEAQPEQLEPQLSGEENWGDTMASWMEWINEECVHASIQWLGCACADPSLSLYPNFSNAQTRPNVNAGRTHSHSRSYAVHAPGPLIMLFRCDLPSYLEAGAMIGINQQMEEESSVEIKNFLNPDKYCAIMHELKSSVQV